MQRRPCFQRPIYVEIMENEENGEFFVVPLETKGRGTPMVNAQFCIRDTSDLIGRNNARGSTHREWRITCCDVGELCSQRVRSPRNASSSLPFWPSSRQQGEEEGNRSEIPSPRSNIHQKLAEIKGGEGERCCYLRWKHSLRKQKENTLFEMRLLDLLS